MLELSENNIHLNAKASDKQQAIEMAAAALEQAGRLFSRDASARRPDFHLLR